MGGGALKLKIQILCGDAIAFGPGKADLLEAIQRAGSIAAAGRNMGMSYRRAWLLVDEINRCFAAPLVEAHAGGGRERGARLTPAGESVLAAYRTIQRDTAVAAEGAHLAAILDRLRQEPEMRVTRPASGEVANP